MKTNQTQLSKIRTHLNVKGCITSWDAIMYYRVTRLSEYIRILRGEGLDIDMERIQPKDNRTFLDKLLGKKKENSNWYGLYTLSK